LLFILVEPKYKAGASLPPTSSVPSIFGAPNFAVFFQKYDKRGFDSTRKENTEPKPFVTH